MTRPAHHRVGRRHIPGLGDDQPSAELIEAYWIAHDLAAHGWQTKRLDFDAHTATAFVAAHAPTRRTVIVSWDLRGNHSARQQVSAHTPARRLIELAQVVASLGLNDAETGEDSLTQLCWLVQSQVGCRPRRHRHWWRDEALPTVPAGQQPPVRTRRAAWLIARLVGKYGWCVRHLGEDIAGGGFIAEIPGDALAIFPATMDDDGTAAAALARVMQQLPPNEVQVLTHLDYRALWAAGQTVERRR